MNRQIKFRGYKDNMFNIDVLALSECSWGCAEGKRGVSIPYQPSIVVMQFTGLLDKNGNEIYEGDILNGRNGIKKIVFWDETRSCFSEKELFIPPMSHSFAKLYDTHKKVFNKDGVLINHWVIGNIYQNPELVK